MDKLMLYISQKYQDNLLFLIKFTMPKLFKKNKVKKAETPILSVSQEIYNKFKELGIKCSDCSALFTDKSTNFDFKNIKGVSKEVQKLEVEIVSKMSGSFKIADAIVDKKTGEVTTPIQYFDAKDEKTLVTSLSSKLIDVALVVADMIKYDDGDFDEDRTFPEWKALFVS